MKKIYYYLWSLVIFACTKEADITTVFDFQVDYFYSQNGIINQAQNIDFVIVPETKVSGTKYFFKYGLTAGTGHFLDADGLVITENQWTALSATTFNLDYIGTSSENHMITIFIREGSGTFEKKRVLPLLVTTIAPSFDVSWDENNYQGSDLIHQIVPQSGESKFNVIGDDGVSQYTMTINTLDEIQGIFYQGVNYNTNEDIPLTRGEAGELETEFSYQIPVEMGTYNTSLIVKKTGTEEQVALNRTILWDVPPTLDVIENIWGFFQSYNIEFDLQTGGSVLAITEVKVDIHFYVRGSSHICGWNQTTETYYPEISNNGLNFIRIDTHDVFVSVTAVACISPQGNAANKIVSHPYGVDITVEYGNGGVWKAFFDVEPAQ